MTSGHIDFDLENLADPNAAAPAGQYTLKITNAEDKNSQKGLRMFVLEAQIVGDEDHAGKTIFEYWGLEGDGYWAKNGRFQVAQLAKAIGLGSGDAFSDMIGAEFEAEVTLEPPTEEFNRESNKIGRIYV